MAIWIIEECITALPVSLPPSVRLSSLNVDDSMASPECKIYFVQVGIPGNPEPLLHQDILSAQLPSGTSFPRRSPFGLRRICITTNICTELMLSHIYIQSVPLNFCYLLPVYVLSFLFVIRALRK